MFRNANFDRLSRVIRGADCPECRLEDIATVPIRFLDAKTLQRKTLPHRNIIIELLAEIATGLHPGTRNAAYRLHKAGFRFLHTHIWVDADPRAGQYSGQVGPGIQNMKRKNVEPEDQGGSLFPRRALHSDAVAASAIRILMGFHPAGSFLNWNPMSSSWYKRALRDMISVKDRCDVAHCHPRSPMLKEPPTE
jgi:hypothetical protein